MLAPYSLAEIQQKLETILDCELNRLIVDKPAEQIANIQRENQDIALHWINIGAKAHTNIGYRVAKEICTAFEIMDHDTLSLWIVQSMEKLDTEGLIPSLQALGDVHSFAKTAKERLRGVSYNDVTRMLSLFLQGLSGRELLIEKDNTIWTDTKTVYLPEYVGSFDNHDDNFKLYKSILAHQWAQIWYGTWKVTYYNEEVQLISLGFCHQHPHADKILALLPHLETIRLDQRIKQDLPGIYRDMHHVLSKNGQVLYPTEWQPFIKPLLDSNASITESCQVAEQLVNFPTPEALCFHGTWQIEETAVAIDKRLQKERGELHRAFWKIADELSTNPKPTDDENKTEEDQAPKIMKVSQNDDDNSSEEALNIEVTLDGKPLVMPIEANDLLSSIIQDFGNVPEEFLQTGLAGAYDQFEDTSHKKTAWSGTYHEDDAFIYNEWDYQRQHYRKDWCVLREHDISEGEIGFVHDTLEKYGSLVKQLHKTFEALRGESKLLKRQTNGDNIDIEAFVDAWLDQKSGMEMSDRLYTQMHRDERSIAVMFMVDMSGSTNGWINEAERESLILLSEALEKLGDRYAIYGFSGWARKRCEIYKIKHFDEAYNETVKRKIAGIEAQNYTRMGVAIRHLSTLLNEVDAKTRILITLSDGRPEDYDEYRGQYGIEDTRMSLLEAKRMGIHSFCITIDKEGLEYLPTMYGPANYIVIEDVAKLPLKVADIYRKLTT